MAALVATTLAAGPAAVAVETSVVDRYADVDIGDVHLQLPKPSSSMTSEEQRFVLLWTGRFRSGALQAYLDSDLEFDDGFNGRSVEEKQRLIDLLVDYWMSLPGVADETAAAASDPNVMDRDDLRWMAYQVIFNKRQLKEEMRAGAAPAGPVAPAQPGVPADAAPAVLTAEDEAKRLAGRLALADAMLRLEATAAPPVDTYEPVHVNTPPVGPEAEGVLTEVVDGIDLQTAPVSASLGEFVAALSALERPATVTATGVTAKRMGPLEDAGLTYVPCFQKPGAGSESCGAALPVSVYSGNLQVGVPATYDVNGDLLPDVRLTVGVDPFALPAASVRVLVERLTASGNVRATARYRLPGTDNVLSVGFDGRTVGLQGSQQVEVTVNDVLASGAETDLTARLTHSGSSPTTTLVAGFASAASPASLAMSTATTITSTPSPITARIASRRAGPVTTYLQTFSHSASVKPSVSTTAAATLGATAVSATVKFDGLPNTVSVTTTAEDTGRGTVTYSAPSQLTGLDAAVKVVPNKAVPGDYLTGSARLANVPTSFTIVTDKLPGTTLGTATVATTLATRMAPTTDPDPRTSITYDASSAVAATTGNALDAGFGKYTGNQPKLLATVGLTSIPPKWQAVLPSSSNRRLTFDTYGASVGRITAAASLSSTTFAQAAIDGFPGKVDLYLPSAGAQRFLWNASGPVAKVTAEGRMGAYEGHLVLTGVPATWTLTLPNSGKASFTAPAAVGAFDAWISTTGTFVPGGAGFPNYATFTASTLPSPKVVNGESISVDVTGAVRFAGVKRISVEPTATGFKFDFEAGAGGAFRSLLKLTDTTKGTKTDATADLVPFPGRVTGEVGSKVLVTTTGSTDLTATVETGSIAALAATPTPPMWHGAAFRDGVSGTGRGFKANLHLTGLPSYLLLENGNVTLTGFRPTVPTLTLDYQRDNDPANLLRLLVELDGLPANGNIGMSFVRADLPGGGSKMTASVSNSAPMGKLRAAVDNGSQAASVETSALPAQMTFTMTEQEGTQTYDWNASAPIARIAGFFHHRQAGQTTAVARGGFVLTDLPKKFTLTTGRDPLGGGALLTYANGAAGTPPASERLDAEAWADGSLTTQGADIKANLEFRLVDLGGHATLAKDSSGALVLTSNGGRIGVVEATVSARGGGSKAWNGKWLDTSWIDLTWSASLNVDAGVDDLTFRLTDIQWFELRPALVSDVLGVFGTFHMSWKAFFARAAAHGEISAVIDWPTSLAPDTNITILSVSLGYQYLGQLGFHVTTPGWQNIWQRGFSFKLWPFGTVGYRAYVDVQPTYHSSHMLLRSLGGLNLGGGSATYQRYMLTPNPFPLILSPLAMQVITGVVKHQGGFIRGGVQKL